jgi:hypothetical protein
LKQLYPHLAALEEIAIRKKIPMCDPFQGAAIGAFRVLAPTKKRYLDMIVIGEDFRGESSGGCTQVDWTAAEQSRGCGCDPGESAMGRRGVFG